MMLKSITLKNLATISDTALEFQSGLNVLTGETGSGKSILVDGLMLATGKRADRSMVRPGTRNAFVEAVFLDSGGSETVVRREISLEGRSRIFIDDSLATLDEVRKAVQHFVELHSQRSTPDLLKSSRQLELLDRFAGTEPLRMEFTRKYMELKDSLAEKEKLAQYIISASPGREILLHEKELFSELKPNREDYRALMERESQLRNAVEHSVLFSTVSEILTSDEGVLSSLQGILRRIRRESPESSSLIDLLEQSAIAVEEASSLVMREMEAGEEAPELMAGIEERLDRYSRLMARFGGTIEAVLQASESLEKRIQEYDNASFRIQELEESCSLLSGELLELSALLTERRVRAGDLLSEKTLDEIRRLNIPRAEFSVEVKTLTEGLETGGKKLSPSGADHVSFMFTANAGIPMEPLESVASGGELSRVALALAIVLADSGSASTLIFDEIDSGTGGETAHLLAKSLLRASETRQTIVISHLAQIASRAHRHLAVEKNYHAGMPVTTVKHLDTSESRVEELARLLGGGDGARDHATRLLEDQI